MPGGMGCDSRFVSGGGLRTIPAPLDSPRLRALRPDGRGSRRAGGGPPPPPAATQAPARSLGYHPVACRRVRGLREQEEMPIVDRRTVPPQVLDDSFAYRRRQRVDRGVAALAGRDMQEVLLPIDVVQPHGCDLARPEPIADEQEQQRVVAAADGGAPINAIQHALHVVPADRPRDRRLAVVPPAGDRPRQIGWDQALPVRVMQKAAPGNIPGTGTPACCGG